MGNKFEKFILLMWKNWLLQLRHPIQTIVEILAPITFTMALVAIRGLVDPVIHEAIHYKPFIATRHPSFINFALAYSPKNEQLDKIINDAARSLYMKTPIISVPDSKSMLIFFENETVTEHVLAGIQFDDALAGNADLPKQLHVSLRFPGKLRLASPISRSITWCTNLLFPLYMGAGPRDYKKTTTAYPGYFQEGFLGVQQALSFSIIKHFNNSFKAPNIFMRRFPNPKWAHDPMLSAMQNIIGIAIMLSFVYTCISTVRMVATEKEKQLKEAMKIMGLPNWLHWTAWFLKSLVFLLISIILMVILLKLPLSSGSYFSVLTLADPYVIFVFLMLYMCTTITFCFAVSVFFAKANTAAAIAGLLWFLSYSPSIFLEKKYETLSLTAKLVTSLASNTAMVFGFRLILAFEGNGEGVQWSNINRFTTPDDNLTLCHIMIMLAVDAVIYLLIALYVEAVMPGEYGIPKVWYFPIQCCFCGILTNKVTDSYQGSPETESSIFEKEPVDLSPGIQIKRLHKKYSKNKVVVKDLSLNMYKGQITVLLGHNGAGKTTTMSMLTGMLRPTSGTALVNGYDVCKDIDKVRKSLGLCPQHNILFDELTVEEHLYFFSKLKGLKKNEVKAEIKKYVELLELEPKAKAQSSTLSGGMKRKLCVGMALCGNSEIVMLDEPTAGMDPSARRALWELMQKQKEGRTMLLTTHYMDEADVLGDRIAIMADGQLQCCGSSFFLKKKYGAGYHLVMDVLPSCDPHKITDLIRKHIHDVEMESSYGSELTYLLPENHAKKFEGMLRDLENKSAQLGIESYGISLTTLEEVFMKVGADLKQDNDDDDDDDADVMDNIRNINRQFQNLDFVTTLRTSAENNRNKRIDGLKLCISQLRALLMKKELSIFRSWTMFVIQITLPVVWLIIAIVVARNIVSTKDSPNLQITLQSYYNPVTVLNGTCNRYCRIYKSRLQRQNHLLIDYKDDDLSEKIFNLIIENMAVARMHYIVGSTFHEDNSITTWFNNLPHHSPPLALKLAIDAIAESELGSDYLINITNYPLPFSIDTQYKLLRQSTDMGFQLAFNVSFSMAFVSAFYVLFYIRERVSKSKHLQFVSGVNLYAFWLVSFVCDYVTFIITVLCLLITLVAFQEDGFKTLDEIGRTLLIFATFGFSMLPMMYLFSYMFDIPSSGFTRVTFFNISTGVAAFTIIQMLFLPEFDLYHLADQLHRHFLIFPHYALCTGLRDNHAIFFHYQLCKILMDACLKNTVNSLEFCKKKVCKVDDRCCKSPPTTYLTYEQPGILKTIVISFSVGIGLIVLILFIEQNILQKLINKLGKSFQTPPADDETEDNDVMDEKSKVRRLQSEEIDDYAIVLKDVTKYYGSFLAVNNICLGVKSYECFGLLGVNGAGKTTTFKMMTGDEPITFGEAWVEGYSLKHDLKKVCQHIGYCPQFDALLDDLTGKETLKMFCLLRGIPVTECSHVIRKLSRDFDFRKHINKKVREYSGGNKRKLSTALALIGDPTVIYLDEPTAGMDPATKRHLWNAVCSIREKGHCIILTSHSMEECEALCTRLAIMVNGQFKCLGSTQHLKSKFSDGYTLTVKIGKTKDINVVQPQEMKKIDDFVKKNFPSAILKEHYQELFTYYIPSKTQPWSKMFGIMERNKNSLDIDDYSIGQSSLEQVFLSFTKEQDSIV